MITHDITRECRFAVRGLLRHRGYALAVIATLAIGIGANTAIFSMFNWILFRPLPGVVRPHELVTVRYQNPKFRDMQRWVSYRDYADVRDGVSAFAGFAASQSMKMDVATGQEAELLWGEIVTTNYLALLGGTPILGRDFVSSEEQPGITPAAIISARLWHRAFDGDPGVLGRRILLDGRSFTVVGVTPPTFQGRSIVTVTDVWIPVGAYATLQPRAAKGLLTSRGETLFGDSFGRLRPGVTLEQAQEQAVAVASNIPRFANRSANADGRPMILPMLTPGIDHSANTRERLGRMFTLLMGAVGLLLLLACANAGNLLLARAAGRRRELAVCLAIGASRGRIIRQQLAEGLILALIAGLAGLCLAIGLTSIFDGLRIVNSLPAVTGVGIDWRVGLFALAASMLTALLFAAAPSIITSRVDLQSSLKDGVTANRGGRRLLRGSLVTVQVTVSVLLLLASGLFARTLSNMRALDLGMSVDGVISLSVNPRQYGYTPERASTYVRGLLDRLRQQPGIQSVAYTWTTPYSPNRNDIRFFPDDQRKISAAATSVSPGFFETVRIPIVAGRDFTDADIAGDNDRFGPIIISRSLAQRLFPDGNVLGLTVPLAYPKGKTAQIIGVVGDVRGQPLADEPEPWAYTPMQMAWGQILVRSSLPSTKAVDNVRQVARSVDQLVTPNDVEPLTASVDRLLTEQRLFARLSGILAGIGVVLAGIGIYGMMAGAVSERRKEFGIRLALGASAVAVRRLVLRTAILLSMTGVLFGLGAAAWLKRFVEARLYGVTPLDPLTIVGTISAMVGLSIVASLLPAIRAARVDPVQSLRVE